MDYGYFAHATENVNASVDDGDGHTINYAIPGTVDAADFTRWAVETFGSPSFLDGGTVEVDGRITWDRGEPA